jgi:hypothetical protein
MAVSRYQNTSQSVPSTPSEPTNNYFDPVIYSYFIFSVLFLF